MPESKMTASAVAQGRDGQRPMLTQNGVRRTATPLAYVANCLTKIEEDFLLRFFEAYCFVGGARPVDDDGGPVGRYVDHCEDVDPDSYVRMEIQAFHWVRKYALGREWILIAEMYLRMEGQRASTSMIDLGGYRTNSYDERVALGGAQVTIKDLGIRLKDAYRDFFRWYGYVKECEEKGREATPAGALNEVKREHHVMKTIEAFKSSKGISKAETGI